jgi:hypothetical protein
VPLAGPRVHARRSRADKASQSASCHPALVHAERSDRKNWSAIWLSPATKGLLLGAHTLASLVIASARSAGCPRSWPIHSQPRRDPGCRFGTEVADDSRHQASPTARMAFEKPVGDYASISICKL